MRVTKAWLVARWEFVRGLHRTRPGPVGSGVVVASLLLTLALLTLQGAVVAPSVGTGVYQVAVTTHDLDSVFRADTRLVPLHMDEATGRALLQAGQVDLVATREELIVDGPREKSLAAASALLEALRIFREETYERLVEADPSLRLRAFPVLVTTQFVPLPRLVLSPPSIRQTPSNTEAGGSLVEPSPRSPATATTSPDDPATVSTQLATTPSKLAPPLPFATTLAVLALLSPTFFFAQAFTNNLTTERRNQTARLLLIVPFRSSELLAGKVLPYLIFTVAGTTAVALVLRTDQSLAGIAQMLLIAATVFPATMMFFALALFAGLLANTYREATAISVLLSMVLSVFLVTPLSLPFALPVSAISPLSATGALIETGRILLGELATAALPFLAFSIAAFTVGTGFWSEDALYARRSLPGKVREAFLGLVRAPWHVMPLSAFMVLVSISLELILLTGALVTPLLASLPVLVVVAAVIEEVLKSLAPAAALLGRKLAPTWRSGVRLGLYTGLSYAAAEKALLFLTLTPLLSTILPAVPDLLGLLVLPFVAHTVSSIGFATMFARNRGRYYGLALALASLLHVSYNLTVLFFLGPTRPT